MYKVLTALIFYSILFIRMTTEVQSHGFKWEKEICINVYGATAEEMKGIKYNSKMDLPGQFNRLNENCDISVKTTGSPNTVCMGDCLRVFDAVFLQHDDHDDVGSGGGSGAPLHLTVIHYTQCDETRCKKVRSIIEVDLTNSRTELFGTVTRAQLEELDALVKSIPQKRKPTNEEHASMYALRDALQAQCGAIYLNIKCDSKSQRRLQCSFNQFQKFITKHPERLVERSETNAFRGGVISSQIVSGRRKLNKKITALPLLPSSPQ